MTKFEASPVLPHNWMSPLKIFIYSEIDFTFLL